MSRRTTVLVVAAAMGVALVGWLLRGPDPATPPKVAQSPRPPPVALGSVDAVRPVVQLPRAQLVDAGAPQQCELSGRVVSQTTQQGIGGAELSFEHAGTVTSVRAGPDGAFALSTPMEGAWSLAAIAAPGFHPYAPEWGHSPFSLNLVRGARVAGLRFALSPEVDYRGEVVDPAGAPIAGAQVSILGGNHALVGAAPPRVSGADGTFVFQAEDGAVLIARHPRYLPGRARVDFAASVTHGLTIRLRPMPADAGPAQRETLAGRVVDAAGQGVPSALVAAQWAESEGAQPDDEALTDADGRFAFEVDPGAWQLTARAQGLVPASARAAVPGPEVLLSLRKGGLIRGRVEDARAQPIAAFTVVVSGRKGPIARVDAVTRSVVDARGAFVVDGLADGPYAVTAHAIGYAPSEEVKAEISGGGEASAVVTLARGAQVAGTVVDRQTRRPLEGARVALEDNGGAAGVQISGETRTGPTGEFLLDGVPPRRVSVFVAAQDHHARILSALDGAEGKVIQVGVVDLGAVEPGDAPRIELVGIGAVLKAEGDGLTLTQVIAGGGAAEVGLVAGDVLLEIDGASAAQLGFAGGIEKIRGPEGTQVHLKVRRVDGSVLALDVPRRRIASK